MRLWLLFFSTIIVRILLHLVTFDDNCNLLYSDSIYWNTSLDSWYPTYKQDTSIGEKNGALPAVLSDRKQLSREVILHFQRRKNLCIEN